MKKDLLGMTIEELKQFATEMGEKPFRGKQLFVWINRGAQSFDEMTDLPLAFRQRLAEEACMGHVRVIDMQIDASAGTGQFWFGLGGAHDSGAPEALEVVVRKHK